MKNKEMMNGKEIKKILEDCYCGADTIKYKLRYQNGDNKTKNINWILNNFNTTRAVAKRLVEQANNGLWD